MKKSQNKHKNSQGGLQASFAKPSLDSHLLWKSAETDGAKVQGPYAGKGPKNYRLSDERIREDVNEALTHHPGIDASDTEIAVKDSVVTLSGTIESRQMKTLAEECVENVIAVKEVKNELRIDTTFFSQTRTSETSAEEGTSRSVSDKLSNH